MGFYGIYPIYPLVIFDIAMKNHHVEWEIPLSMAMFHSYVCLPEGTIWLDLT